MEVAVHIDALRAEGGRTAAAVELAGPGAAVPTCPEWVVRDLVRHLGGVHRWATGYVADARTEVWPVGLDEVVGTWPDDADLAGWLLEGCEALAAALAAAPADLQCWTFLRAPSPLAMWARRQAHETAVHRVDAELAAGGPPAPFAAPFAADGVDELLSCFVPRRSTGLRAETPATLAVALHRRRGGVGADASAPRVPRRRRGRRTVPTARSAAQPATSTWPCGTAPAPMR